MTNPFDDPVKYPEPIELQYTHNLDRAINIVTSYREERPLTMDEVRAIQENLALHAKRLTGVVFQAVYTIKEIRDA